MVGRSDEIGYSTVGLGWDGFVSWGVFEDVHRAPDKVIMKMQRDGLLRKRISRGSGF